MLISALAAVGSTAIITVAIVASLLGVSLLFKNVGYDYIDYSLSVKNSDGQTLYGKLSSYEETIAVVELASDENVSVRFDNLLLNMSYIFEVVDGEGKVYFKDETKTRSPLTFYTRDELPETLFFSADLSVFDGSGNYYPMLQDGDGLLYEIPLETGWENETAIPLDMFLPGEYTMLITDSAGDFSYNIYWETVYIDGLLPLKLVYKDDVNDKVFISVNEKLRTQYDQLRFMLVNSDGEAVQIIDDKIDSNLFDEGYYSIVAFGIKDSIESEIYREEIYLSGII